MNALTELKTFLKSLPKLNDENKQYRTEKALGDFRYFVKTYLSHHVGGDKKDSSIFRNWVYDELANIKHNKIQIKAYRGAAKTTLSRLFVLWKILSGDKRHVIIISSTLDLAKEGIEVFKTELEDNANLISDFDIKDGGVCNAQEIILNIKKTPCKIKAFGSGKKIRGTNFLSMRPDLIICDDIENDENVESKTQRDKLYKWFNKAVLKLPSRLNANYTIIVIGTALHYDSLLQKIEQRNDFLSFDFPLIIDFPKNIETLNKENLHSFNPLSYKLDDNNINIKEILSDFLEDRSSFFSEFQNQPLDKDSSPLANYTTYNELPSSISCAAIGIDPSLGKKRGDYFGLSTLFYSKQQSKLYASAKGYKLPPDKMIDKILAYFLKAQKITHNITIACEEVAFQEFFKNELKKRFVGLGIFIPIIGIKNTKNKEIRLDGLSTLLSQGDMLIQEQDFLLREELDTYPKCPHDDLLDSIELAKRVINAYSSANYKQALMAQKDFSESFNRLRNDF